MGGHSTYYISSIYPSSAMSVPTNDFSMVDLHLSNGVSSRGSRFYSMGYPLHEVAQHPLPQQVLRDLSVLGSFFIFPLSRIDSLTSRENL
jgi:hypothetical protein